MLRQSPRLTPASLAARRANALKSTGPRTDQGKARAGLNPLKHGRYAVNLPDRLVRAGYPSEAAEWHTIRDRIARTFEPASRPASAAVVQQHSNPNDPGDPDPKRDSERPAGKLAKTGPGVEKKMDRLANWIWCWRRDWQQQEGAKLESPLESEASAARLSHPSQIRIYDPWARRGLVFYAQRRRGWVWRQLQARIVSRQAPDLGGRWAGTASSGCATGADTATGGCATGGIGPGIESEMESGLRSRGYRMGRPRFWEQIRYCLDREGVYHPEWRVRYSQMRRELRNSPMAMWLEPHPILAGMRQQEEAETCARSGGGR